MSTSLNSMEHVATMGSTSRPRRKSAFQETGLFEDEEPSQPPSPLRRARPALKVRFRSKNDIFEHAIRDGNVEETEDSDTEFGWEVPRRQTVVLPTSNLMPSIMHRLSLVAFMLAVVIPIAQFTPFGASSRPFLGATSIPVPETAEPILDHELVKRDATDYCKRWSQQSALVNGTLYLYGGRKTTSSSQTSNTWNNDFLTLDLTKTWQISSPSMAGLVQPSGPPSVANGYLWNSYDSLYLYGGEFSDNPQGTPTAFSLWEYKIKSSAWIEHSNPETSAGKNSEAGGIPIQRAAEGAGFSIASLGRGWYFGGHLDFLTTETWSIQTPRVYLKSFIEYTFSGTVNKELTSSQTAGSDGAWRNITNAGIQTQAGFTQRADGLLVYIPGFSDEGILLSLGGGTNETFTQMNEVDVYDISGSMWYRQATSGTTPKIRVNPCAVVAAAADGSSYNVYMFGGQNLIPYNQQIQYNDMWILSIPSFTWISVDMSSQSVPYARAGHTCNIWDGQMVVVGGYIGTDISCETPGIYVFNMSSLQWENQYTSLSSQDKTNPLAQQQAQKGRGVKDGLEGSYGYRVPVAVVSAIGGNAYGGATITKPIQTATSGPMASGTPITYTVTGANGTNGNGVSNNGGSNAGSVHRLSIGLIIAIVFAGILALLAVYLAFCAWVYRKQRNMARRHVSQAQQDAQGPQMREGGVNGAHTSLIGPYHHRPSNSISTSYANSSEMDGANDVVRGSQENLLEEMEISFVGVFMRPREALRIVNKDLNDWSH